MGKEIEKQIQTIKEQLKTLRQQERFERQKNDFVGIKRRINVKFIELNKSEKKKDEKKELFVLFLNDLLSNLE